LKHLVVLDLAWSSPIIFTLPCVVREFIPIVLPQMVSHCSTCPLSARSSLFPDVVLESIVLNLRRALHQHFDSLMMLRRPSLHPPLPDVVTRGAVAYSPDPSLICQARRAACFYRPRLGMKPSVFLHPGRYRTQHNFCLVTLSFPVWHDRRRHANRTLPFHPDFTIPHVLTRPRM